MGLPWPCLSFLAVVVHSPHFLAPLSSKQLALFVLGDFPYLLPHFREAHNSVFQPFDCSLFKLKQLIRPLLFSFCPSPSSPAAPPHPFSFKRQLNLNPFSLQKKKTNHSHRPRSDPESRGNGWTRGIGERAADPALSRECGSSAPPGSRADSDPSWVEALQVAGRATSISLASCLVTECSQTGCGSGRLRKWCAGL